MSVSFTRTGQTDPQAEATKQEFNNAASGFKPEAQQQGDIERPDDPQLRPVPPEECRLDPDLAALAKGENAKLALEQPDEVAWNKSPGLGLDR